MPDCCLDGRIRHATRDDIPAIERLMRRAQADDGIPRISSVDIDELMALGEWIVLEVDVDELVGAACLTTSCGVGHLACVVADPAVPGVESRVLGVAAALSESQRCEPRFPRSWRAA